MVYYAGSVIIIIIMSYGISSAIIHAAFEQLISKVKSMIKKDPIFLILLPLILVGIPIGILIIELFVASLVTILLGACKSLAGLAWI